LVLAVENLPAEARIADASPAALAPNGIDRNVEQFCCLVFADELGKARDRCMPDVAGVRAGILLEVVPRALHERQACPRRRTNQQKPSRRPAAFRAASRSVACSCEASRRGKTCGVRLPSRYPPSAGWELRGALCSHRALPCTANYRTYMPEGGSHGNPAPQTARRP
jgi:hypothetical protein